MKLIKWMSDGRQASGLYTVSDENRNWVIAHVESEFNVALIAAAPCMRQALVDIRSRLMTALKYGPDMASSRQVCIQDALASAIQILAKLEEGV